MSHSPFLFILCIFTILCNSDAWFSCIYSTRSASGEVATNGFRLIAWVDAKPRPQSATYGSTTGYSNGATYSYSYSYSSTAASSTAGGQNGGSFNGQGSSGLGTYTGGSFSGSDNTVDSVPMYNTHAVGVQHNTMTPATKSGTVLHYIVIYSNNVI